MAKKQTRRSISVRGVTYEQLRVWCDAHHVAMSEFIETRIAEYLGKGKSEPARSAGRVPTTSHLVTRSSRPALRVSEPAEARNYEKPAPARPLLISCPAPAPEAARPLHIAPAPTPPSVGRPAPTPASKVLKVIKNNGSDDSTDYRAIRF